MHPHGQRENNLGLSLLARRQWVDGDVFRSRIGGRSEKVSKALDDNGRGGVNEI